MRELSAKLTEGEKNKAFRQFSLPQSPLATAPSSEGAMRSASIKQSDKYEFDSDLTGNPLWGKIYGIGGMRYGIQMELKSTLSGF